MLRLIIDNVDADLYENAPVNLRLQTTDITELNNPLSSYSQTFRLPLTPHNRTIFGDIDELGLQGGLDLQQRITASLYSESWPLINGFLQVKAVYQTKEHYAEVECVFFSGVADLKTELGEKLLTDLDLTAYNHTVNYDNIEDTRTATTGIAPEVRYGLMDKGDSWTSSDLPWTSTDGIEQHRLTIFLQAYAILEAIMDEAGFTYDSSFIQGVYDSTFGRLYLPLANGNRFIQPAGEYAEDLRATLSSGTQTLTSLATNRILFQDNLTNCFDEGDNWFNSGNYYNAPATARYTVRLTYSFSNPSNRTINIRLMVGSTAIETITTTATIGQNLTYSRIVNANTGDDIYFRAWATSPTGNETLQGSGDYSSGTRTSLEIIAGTPKSGFTAGIKENMPEMKQIDFLTSLQKMFNLVFVPSRTRPNHLDIQTFDDFLATGDNKDWSNKVDYGKDVKIAPTTDLQKREYIWTHAEGTDLVNKAVQDSLDRTYGRFRLLDNTNAFSTGSQTIQTSFAPFVLSLIPGTEWPVMRLLNPESLDSDQAAIDNPKPMLCFVNRNSLNYGNWYIRNDANTTTNLGAFNFFSNYSSDDPTVTDMDLNFGLEQPLHDIAANPANTLYFEYWAQYVANLYSADSRIMDCHIRLDQSDIADFEFSDKVFIKDTVFRVLSLSYDANTPSVAKAKLIRVLEDVLLCAETPTGYQASQNAVTFNNQSTNYGSEACCELYGYTWGGTRCRPKNSILET